MLITKFLVALAAPVFCIAATIPANTGGLVVPRSPISGGDAAEPGESVSTVVSIQKLGRSQRGVHICGGSFITRYLVITATHCVRGVAQQELRVLAGTTVSYTVMAMSGMTSSSTWLTLYAVFNWWRRDV